LKKITLYYNNLLSNSILADATGNSIKQTTQIKKDVNEKTKPEPAKSSVKSNKPITLDFANMISALEVIF